jgi:maleylacetoacetate isomerase
MRGARVLSATLYDYWRSSASYRVRIALNLLGIEHARVPVNLLRGEHRTPEHLARNPQGLVPALEIDGLTLTQSLAILEYLDETREACLLPRDAAGRARVRTIAYAIAMEIHPICNLAVARHAAEASAGAIAVEGWMNAFIGPGLAAVERLLDHPAAGRFCHGDRVGLADICLVPQIYNARRWDVDLAPMPIVRRIAETLEAHPAFAAAHPERIAPT